MKKYLLLTASLLGFLNLSCISDDWHDNTENAIVVEPPIIGKFQKFVLIEDYTGTWCQFCPRVLHGIEKVEEEHLKAFPVSIHRNGSASVLDPYNFNALPLEQVNGVTGYPAARLNRKTRWINDTTTPEVKNLVKTNTDLGISLNSTVAGGNINLDVNVKFVADYSNLSLVVYVVEDGLVYNQVNATSYFNGQNPIVGFTHNHVLRSCLTDLVNGMPLTGTINGATVTKNFNIAVPANVADASKISFVAFVIDAAGNALNVKGAKANVSASFDQHM